MPYQSSKKDKGKGRVHSTHKTTGLHWLNLPLELREKTYSILVEECPGSLLDLFVANHQIAKELEPFLFKRQLTFDGQEELFRWLGHVDHRFLRNVQDVRFKLHDINPDQIFGALGKRLKQANITRENGSRGPDTKDNPYYEACQVDLKRIVAAFRLLPNVKNFELLECTKRDPQAHERTWNTFSQVLGNSFKDLRNLRNEVNELPVDFLSCKPKLRRVRFLGTSSSDSEEIEQALEGLNLDELELHHPSEYEPADEDEPFGCVADFLEFLPSLKSLTILDESDQPYRLAAEVFVHSKQHLLRHKDSLCSLRILDNLGPIRQCHKDIITNQFTHFIATTTSLTHLSITESYFPTLSTLPSIPLKSITIRLDIHLSPSGMSNNPLLTEKIESIAGQIGFRELSATKNPKLPKLGASLKRVELVLDKEAVRKEKGVGGALRSQGAMLRDLGIELVWRIWEGREKI
ncbi:hypothetical protein MMC21_005529 [Puttea exsequens]|nr:hypothetical protein [Puttea exsequens]